MPGDPRTQRAYAAQSLAIARDIAARPQEAKALGVIGLSHLADGNPGAAAAALRQSTDLYQQIDMPVPAQFREALQGLAGT